MMQRGSALISAVVLLVLVGIVGIVLLRSTRSDVQVSLASVHARQAHYLALSGLETARERLRSQATPAQTALAAAAGPNGTIDFSTDALRVVYDAAQRPTGLSGYGDDVPLRPFTVLADGAYAAFVHTDGSGRVVLTGVGAGPARSLETVQAIVAATER